MSKRERRYASIEHEHRKRRLSEDQRLDYLLDKGNLTLEETVAVVTNKGMELFVDFLIASLEEKLGDIINNKLDTITTKEDTQTIMEQCMIQTVSGFISGLNGLTKPSNPKDSHYTDDLACSKEFDIEESLEIKNPPKKTDSKSEYTDLKEISSSKRDIRSISDILCKIMSTHQEISLKQLRRILKLDYNVLMSLNTTRAYVNIPQVIPSIEVCVSDNGKRTFKYKK